MESNTKHSGLSENERPLAIDLFCGLGGWSEGLLAEGFKVIGFDIEAHDYGDGKRYPAQLVIQDVLTLHGSQFKDAALIVASPPCQEYSYMAMPWSRAKAIEAEYRSGKREVKKLTALFDACFRIQREACEAAGRHIPMVVENVRGAQKWVGRSKWNYGSFHLWGDVPALMPIPAQRRMKSKISCVPRNFSDRVASTPEEAHALHYRLPTDDGLKLPGNNSPLRWEDREIVRLSSGGQDFTRIAARQISKAWRDKHYDQTAKALTNQAESDGVKQPGISGVRDNGKGDLWFQDGAARHGSKSKSRKAASALIAKIPLVLSRHIARVYKPNSND